MRHSLSLVLFFVLIASFAPAALAADPSGGDLSSAKDEVTWSGGPLFVSNPALCLTSTDPTCDSFRLTVSSPAIQRVLVAIAPLEGYEQDDYDLFVYDDQGLLLGSSTKPDGFESVVFEHNGSSFYEVRVQPWLVTAGSRYTGVAMRTREQALDIEQGDCLELIPEALSVPGLLDDGRTIELTVMLLLDGTDAAVATEQMAKAAESYRPLGIELVLKKTRKVNFTSTVSGDLISDAKALVGGVPPKGIDLVGVFTSKTMQGSAGGTTVVGQADCIGGIRWDEHSFFVVSDIRDIEDPQTGTTGTLNEMGLNPNVDATAEVFAHEIGHLMGAHHHYANCVEGNLSSAGPGDVSPCSLMFNAVNFASLNFTAVSGSVVRGHAVEFAGR
jgi:hypothetical protein